MQHKFTVTDVGLTIDKITILAGSELTLSSQPPAHWSRFGEYGQGEEKALVVASPAKKTKKRAGLEKQAASFNIELVDGTSDDDLIEAIKAAKDAK